MPFFSNGIAVDEIGHGSFPWEVSTYRQILTEIVQQPEAPGWRNNVPACFESSMVLTKNDGVPTTISRFDSSGVYHSR